jgi:hypothetical protein
LKVERDFDLERCTRALVQLWERQLRGRSASHEQDRL